MYATMAYGIISLESVVAILFLYTFQKYISNFNICETTNDNLVSLQTALVTFLSLGVYFSQINTFCLIYLGRFIKLAIVASWWIIHWTSSIYPSSQKRLLLALTRYLQHQHFLCSRIRLWYWNNCCFRYFWYIWVKLSYYWNVILCFDFL